MQRIGSVDVVAKCFENMTDGLLQTDPSIQVAQVASQDLINAMASHSITLENQ